MKRTALGIGKKSLDRGSTFDRTRSELARSGGLARTSLKRKGTKTPARRAVSPASAAQRDKVLGRPCIVCFGRPIDPAHLVDRSLGGCDDPLCVVPLCRGCHRRYDEGDLDLSPYLEPNWRAEVAHAISHLGLHRAMRRITNTRPESK